MPNQKLVGTPASGGKTEGIVKVLTSVDDFKKMEKGDIIVVYASSPAWTVPLLKAKALISEVGGILCHTAIVAREIGVPSVVGVDNATKILKDGDVVKIDGELGEIYVSENG
jgi:pyruvate,water dikinase